MTHVCLIDIIQIYSQEEQKIKIDELIEESVMKSIDVNSMNPNNNLGYYPLNSLPTINLQVYPNMEDSLLPFDRYSNIQQIGSGTFSRVYKVF